jgi:hypothetical protein
VTYSDSLEVCVGDRVRFSSDGTGVVVACIDRDEFSPGHPREQWARLGGGVLIDTSFGGLVHYPDQEALDTEGISLVSRSEF